MTLQTRMADAVFVKVATDEKWSEAIQLRGRFDGEKGVQRKYNPNHSPVNGRFTSRAGGSGINVAGSDEEFAFLKDAQYRRTEDPATGATIDQDEGLVLLMENRGYFGKPDALEHGAFEKTDKLSLDMQYGSEKSPTSVFYRGIQDDGWGVGVEAMTKGLTEGTSRFHGVGSYGNGLYFAAEQRLAVRYAGTSGMVQRVALKPDAKVITSHELVAEAFKLHGELGLGYNNIREHGRLATWLGYDVIHADDRLVVLNHSKLIIDRSSLVRISREEKSLDLFDVELKFNPYHSSSSGRFVSGPAGDVGGSNGGKSDLDKRIEGADRQVDVSEKFDVGKPTFLSDDGRFITYKDFPLALHDDIAQALGYRSADAAVAAGLVRMGAYRDFKGVIQVTLQANTPERIHRAAWRVSKQFGESATPNFNWELPGRWGEGFDARQAKSLRATLKFNPNHSRANGRFVSAPAGDFSGGGGPSQDEMHQMFIEQARAAGLDTSGIDGTMNPDDKVLTDPDAVMRQFISELPHYKERPYRNEDLPEKSGYGLVAQYHDVKKADGTTEMMHTHDNVEFILGKDFDRKNMSFSEPGTANAVNLSQQRLWEAQNYPYLRMEAAQRGMSVNQLRAELQTAVSERVASDLAQGGVFTRVPNATLDHILADGRFKNQFESNRSKGSLNQELRADFEHTMWGYAKPTPPEGQRYRNGMMAGTQRRTFDGAEEHAGNPLYGYLDFRPTGGTTPGLKVSKDSFEGDWLDQYGPISIKMKSSVLPRTSWSSSDTFTYKRQSSPVLSPSYRSALPTYLGNYPSLDSVAVPKRKLKVPEGKESSLPWYKERRVTPDEFVSKYEKNGAIEGILSRNSRKYGDYSGGEVQFHGGLTVKDIEKVYLPSKPSAKTRKALDEAGVQWEVVGAPLKSWTLKHNPNQGKDSRVSKYTWDEEDLVESDTVADPSVKTLLAARDILRSPLDLRIVVSERMWKDVFSKLEDDMGRQLLIGSTYFNLKHNPYHDERGRFASARGYFSGGPVNSPAPLTKAETGRIGEEIAMRYLGDTASTLNVGRNNYPIDLVSHDRVVEVKTGLSTNPKASQQWRATIGQPGKKEREWLKTATAEEKRAWNNQKRQAILERKQRAVDEVSKKLGRPLKPTTLGVIIDPNTREAHVYEFEGFHLRIGWSDKGVKEAYRASYKL